MNNRIVWVDNARAIGIFLVVLGHLSLACNDLKLWIFSFHMPLFYILSGYLTNNSRLNNRGDYFRRCFYTTIVPYLFFAIITLPFYWPTIWLNRQLFSINSVEELVWKTAIGIFIPFNNNPFSWSIFVNLPLWFLLSLFGVKVLYGFSAKWILWGNMILSVCFILITVALKRNSFDALPWYLHTIFFAYPFFIIGTFLRKKNILDRILTLSLFCRLMIIVVCLSVGYFCAKFNGRMSIGSITYGRSIVLCVITGMLGTCSIITLSSLIPRTNALQIIGGGSIVILGLHDIIKIYLGVICGRLGISNSSMPIVLGVLYSGMVVALCVPVILYLTKYHPVLIGKRKVL